MRTAGRSVGHGTLWYAMHRNKGIDMNKQIKELEKQCWSHRVDGVLVDGHLHFDTEKFAELIVKECRDIVEQDMKLAHIQMIPLTLEKYANGRLKEKIKEHFGVE
jgi:hypothetical protein